MSSRRDDPPDGPPPTEPAPATRDVVVLAAPTDDGDGHKVLRLREGRLEAGEVRPLREGRPITGEVVGLRPRADDPRVCDVTVHAKAPAPTPPADDAMSLGHKGPARVNSAAFREGWDSIFGVRAPDPSRPN